MVPLFIGAEWELTLPNVEYARNQFSNGDIQNILLVVISAGCSRVMVATFRWRYSPTREPVRARRSLSSAAREVMNAPFGDSIRGFANKLAASGCTALIPDYFKGTGTPPLTGRGRRCRHVGL